MMQGRIEVRQRGWEIFAVLCCVVYIPEIWRKNQKNNHQTQFLLILPQHLFLSIVQSGAKLNLIGSGNGRLRYCAPPQCVFGWVAEHFEGNSWNLAVFFFTSLLKYIPVIFLNLRNAAMQRDSNKWALGCVNSPPRDYSTQGPAILPIPPQYRQIGVSWPRFAAQKIALRTREDGKRKEKEKLW